MTGRSKKIKSVMTRVGNYREKEACVASSKDCSVKAPCLMCRRKGRELQMQMQSVICMSGEVASDPVWDDFVFVDEEPEPKAKETSWMRRLIGHRAKEDDPLDVRTRQMTERS